MIGQQFVGQGRTGDLVGPILARLQASEGGLDIGKVASDHFKVGPRHCVNNIGHSSQASSTQPMDVWIDEDNRVRHMTFELDLDGVTPGGRDHEVRNPLHRFR